VPAASASGGALNGRKQQLAEAFGSRVGSALDLGPDWDNARIFSISCDARHRKPAAIIGKVNSPKKLKRLGM
jgi:hypothetical protein